MLFANLIDIQLIPEETWLIQTEASSRFATSAILGDLKWSDWAQTLPVDNLKYLDNASK